MASLMSAIWRMLPTMISAGESALRKDSATARTIEPAKGLLTVHDLADKIRPDDGHYAQTRLVCLENTHNRGGGQSFGTGVQAPMI